MYRFIDNFIAIGGKQYYVYILTNKPEGTLYIGVTNSLFRRINDHKTKRNNGFTARYELDKLVYYEIFSEISLAISREKQLKNWRRHWKLNIIKKFNPQWKDLSEEIIKAYT